MLLLMRKFLGILALGLLWCNTSFAACLEGDCKNGLGVYLYSGGCKYVGEYKDGFKYGEGKLICPKFIQYEGGYKNNLYHGNGTYTWPDGDKYVGEFEDGVMHGQGSLIYANGKIKKGIWKNGKLVKKQK